MNWLNLLYGLAMTAVLLALAARIAYEVGRASERIDHATESPQCIPDEFWEARS